MMMRNRNTCKYEWTLKPKVLTVRHEQSATNDLGQRNSVIGREAGGYRDVPAGASRTLVDPKPGYPRAKEH